MAAWPEGIRVEYSGAFYHVMARGNRRERIFLDDGDRRLRIYDYRARQYQPELGRFLQPDPQEFDAGDYNLYRYCHNDPVNRSDPTGLEGLISQGHGDWDFWNGRVALEQMAEQAKILEKSSTRDMPGGAGRKSQAGSLDDSTMNQLQNQLVATKDSTTSINESGQVSQAATEVKVPRSGDPIFGYRDHAEEHFNLSTDAARIIHAHTREGKEQALPSQEHYDYKAVQDSKGRSMYFTSRYLARHRADPSGEHKGKNYIILHHTGSRRFDIPRFEYRFDPRLVPPPLP